MVSLVVRGLRLAIHHANISFLLKDFRCPAGWALKGAIITIFVFIIPASARKLRPA